VLGIPADPRLIEVIGWLAYLVPVALFVYWPRARRAQGRQIATVQFGIAGALALVALGLVAFVPRVGSPEPPAAHISGSTDAASGGTAHLDGSTLRYSLGGHSTTVRLSPAAARPAELGGIRAQHWKLALTPGATQAPASLTLTELVTLNGGRLPVGVNAQANPGPFTAKWATGGSLEAWAADGVLLDASQTARTVVTLSGGGLTGPRTVTVAAPQYAAPSWSVTDAAAQAAATAVTDAAAAQTERRLWAVQLPIALGLAALVTAAFGLRSRRRALTSQKNPVGPTASPAIPATPQRSNSYAAQ
jgi:high-affinity iron transporter